MGVYVRSRIIPGRIAPEAWHALYLRTLEFLSGCPPTLMGARRSRGQAIERRVFTRGLEHCAAEPGQRHWLVVGDFDSMEWAESFLLYADLGHYRGTEGSGLQEPPEDILQELLGDDDRGHWNVFDDKTQGHDYHTPMLAVAMLIEDRFPLYAFTGGDIDRAQAQIAQTMIEETLGIEVALPLCVDAERLFARIGRYVKGKDAIERFDLLFQGDELALFRLAPRRDLEAWVMDVLRHYSSPGQLGVTRLAMRWLDADRDLATLCRLACLDEAGPRFDPVAFAATLAATWVTVPEAARSALAPFARPTGAPDTVHSQLGMALLDMTGLQGRRIRRFIPRDEALAVLSGLFPERAGPIREGLDARVAQIVQGLETVRGPVDDLARRSRDEPESGDGRSFLRFRSAATLSEAQRTQFRYFACTANRLLSLLPEQVPDSASWTTVEIGRMLERACDAQDLTLTEDAWAWIESEPDRELLSMLLAFAAMNEREQRFWNIRLALFEHRAFAVAVLAASRDPAVCDEIAGLGSAREG